MRQLGGGGGAFFFSSPHLDFSIRFTGKAKIWEITLWGMEKGPLPRMQQFSIIATDN